MTDACFRTHPRQWPSTVVRFIFVLSLLVVAIVVVVQEGWDAYTPLLSDEATTTSSLDNNHRTTEILSEKHPFSHRRLDEMVVIEVDTVSETEQLSTEVSFEDILKTVVFLLATFLAANLSKLVTLPSFVGEIIAGVVLGPPVLNFCPYPEAMVLVGSFGLIGLILNSGIDLDIAQLRETGTRAVMIAVSGTILALSTGIGVSYLVSADTIQSAFSIGAAFAPSSWGVELVYLELCGAAKYYFYKRYFIQETLIAVSV